MTATGTCSPVACRLPRFPPLGNCRRTHPASRSSPDPTIRGGFKGMAEGGTLGAAAAVAANAIADALKPLGVHITTTKLNAVDLSALISAQTGTGRSRRSPRYTRGRRLMTQGIEIGIVLEPRGDVRQLVDRAKLAEELGFQFIGITDGQMIWSDAVVALTATALATKRIRMGPWVTNPVTRHVTVIANYICTLDALSDGRAFLGIGNGDDAVRTIGASPATMDDLAGVVDTIRALVDGQEVKHDPVSWRISPLAVAR